MSNSQMGMYSKHKLIEVWGHKYILTRKDILYKQNSCIPGTLPWNCHCIASYSFVFTDSEQLDTALHQNWWSVLPHCTLQMFLVPKCHSLQSCHTTTLPAFCGRLKGDWRCIRTIPWWHLLEDRQYSSDSSSTPISISLWKGHSGNSTSPGWRDASVYKGPPQSLEPQQKACKELAHCIPVWVSAQMGRGLVWSVVVQSNY